MRTTPALFLISCALLAGSAPAQPAVKPQFEVATVRPAAPLDIAKLQAQVASGKSPSLGMHLDGLRAEYTYVALKELITIAYKVKSYQLNCPDWMANARFDITARMPEGSKKDDATEMLKNLLQERFKLQAHMEPQERPVLALVVAKGGPKLKDSPAPPPTDESAPLEPGEMKLDLPDGPARATASPDGTHTVVNMGTRGTYTQTMDLPTQSLKLEGSGISMPGLVDILSQVMQIGGSGSKQVVDQSGLTGHYEVALTISLAELIAATRAQAAALSGGTASEGAGQASDPGSAGSSVYGSVEKMGLKLEPRKAIVQQLVVDHAEKTPTEN